MIILIVAESSTGKTQMAQNLLEIYKVPYFSIDHLKMGIYKTDRNCGFEPTSDNEIIEGKLWPIIKAMITTCIDNGQNLIVEGCYVSPGRLAEFGAEYSKEIIPVFMGFTENYVRNHFLSDIIPYRSVIERRPYPEGRTAEEIIHNNAALRQRCAEEGVCFFDIDEDYEKDTAKIYRWIAQRAEQMKFTQ